MTGKIFVKNFLLKSKTIFLGKKHSEVCVSDVTWKWIAPMEGSTGWDVRLLRKSGRLRCF